ncbi:hypothetical protein CRG98_026053 [Punica granatum]|uniref:Uncharacterized protein n=1 Tax=Punica granatum TaxID=22663 RepID=A0A2I0JBC1_PUNGR|nr:hypothetical protein CRG98_026053 [Punica granatum]
MEKREMQEPTYFGAKEATLDPCGPRELSATPLKGSRCARWYGSRTVTTSSRGRVRVMRDPLNVMARLAKVVGGNGTCGGRMHTRGVLETRLFAWLERGVGDLQWKI